MKAFFYDGILHQKNELMHGSWNLQVCLNSSTNKLVSTHSLYNVHQSRIWFIGFSDSGLGLVKIILRQYISDWEAENPCPAQICQLLFNIFLVYIRATREIMVNC